MERRHLGAQAAAEQPLLDAGVVGPAALRAQVGVAGGVKRHAEGLEEARLLDARPGAGAERGAVRAAAHPPGDRTAGDGAGAVAVVVLDAAAHGDEDVASEHHPVLRVGAEVRALGRDLVLAADGAEGPALVLDVSARGDEVARPRLRLDLVAERRPRGEVAEAGLAREVGDSSKPTTSPKLRRVGAGVLGIERRVVRARVPGDQAMQEPVPGGARRLGGNDGHVALGIRVEVGTAERGLARRAHPAALAAEGEAQGRCAPRSAPTEAAPAVCSKALLGCSLSVVSRDAPAFQSKPSAAPRRPAAIAHPVEAPALGLEAQAGPGADGRAPGHEVQDAAQRVGPVQAARRAAHDLDPLHLEDGEGAEVERAAGLVGGHAVDEDAPEVRGAAAQEDRPLHAHAAGAGHAHARDLLQDVEQVRRLLLRDADAFHDVGGDAEGGARPRRSAWPRRARAPAPAPAPG